VFHPPQKHGRGLLWAPKKVAVITGASQGIGAALVKAYRDRNYRVVATSCSIKLSNDDEVLAVPGDIADRKMVERAISEGMARFGRIDTLVNNAGIFIAKPFTQYTEVITRRSWASTTPVSFTSLNSQ
jgi:NAD(P)-dependent dehydrogenase (short-subunit alcohol dehydrogenase family)